MPCYDYECRFCGAKTTEIVEYENRKVPQLCTCGAGMDYQFPLGAVRGIQHFEPMYCEVFDCDVNGKREWEEIKRAEGVVEKGERSGLRNEEKSRHAVKIAPQKPVGRSYADVQRTRDKDNALVPQIEKMMDARTTQGGSSDE